MQRIFHPTDFSNGGESAFVHALKLAVNANALLEVLHVDRHPEQVTWDDFPQVRETLSQWGLLPDWALPEDVERLGIGVHKVLLAGNDPVSEILKHLSVHRPDLIVIAAHHREGIDRWLHQDISKKIARNSHTSCLFVPHGVDGFVAREDGCVQLQKVVMPIASEPDAAGAIAQCCELARLLDCKSVTATLVHVGDDENVLRNFAIPDIDGWTWELVVEDGDPATQILKTADDRGADLIALTTQGHHGFLDALRGSTSDQIVRNASCPILAVPAEWHGE
jgi:nucleotide-binding universal stress UspA family protein